MLHISESSRSKCQKILSGTDTAFNKFRKIFEVYKSQLVGTELYYAILGLIDDDKIIMDIEEDSTSSEDKAVKSSGEVTIDLQGAGNYWLGKCEQCGEGEVWMDTSRVLTSNPPKYICKCSNCGAITYKEC